MPRRPAGRGPAPAAAGRSGGDRSTPGTGRGSTPPTAPGPAPLPREAGVTPSPAPGAPRPVGSAGSGRSRAGEPRVGVSRPVPARPATARTTADAPGAARPAASTPSAPPTAPAPPTASAPPTAPAPVPDAGGGAGVQMPALSGPGMTIEELAEASGLDVRAVQQLESYGLVSGRAVGGVPTTKRTPSYWPALAAGFASYGVEARHLRLHKHAAEREAGLHRADRPAPAQAAQSRGPAAGLRRRGRPHPAGPGHAGGPAAHHVPRPARRVTGPCG